MYTHQGANIGLIFAYVKRFVEPIKNVTVTAGRDVKLTCVVDNLASYKVGIGFSLWVYKCVTKEGIESAVFKQLYLPFLFGAHLIYRKKIHELNFLRGRKSIIVGKRRRS